MKKIISFSIILLHFSLLLNAQETKWPVQVTGSLLPPHSLDLKVYGSERASDLNFRVLLNDPEELTLRVLPVLSIEQNGTIISQTDLNQSFNPITLNQLQTYNLDGKALDQLLSNEALTNQTYSGTGSINVPEGFTQICLQMYGADRVVPVSNKFCISANFRLNQPPQIIKPAFNEKIKMSQVQNMIFSWLPMHLSSGNNPGAVEYLFELVELPSGYMNSNDVFESALKIYSTRVMSNSLIYTQAEPILNPNTYYAWRVTASSVMYPTSKLFQNEGRSEISMFLMYDGDAPTTEINPFDKPAPRGCSVYETSYGSVDKADNKSTIIGPNQIVKLGYFKMKIAEAEGNIENGFSGKGLVEYPMLRSSIPVEFKNIKVNQEGRVYVSEKIESLLHDDIRLSSDQLKSNQISKYVNDDYASKLFSKISEEKYVDKIPQGQEKKNSLPLVLKNEKFNNELVCVTGIQFTPSNAYLNFIGLEIANEEVIGISAATAVAATPHGIKSNSYLVPLSSASGSASIVDLATVLVSRSQNKDSKLDCDCTGITEKNIGKSYIVHPDLIINRKDQSPVSIKLSDKNQAFDNYNGNFESVPEFIINGIQDVSFSAAGGNINISNQSKLTLTDEVKSIISDNISKGVLMTGLKAKIPNNFNLQNSEEVLLDNGFLLIDSESIKYANVSKQNLIALKDGHADKWNYSVDEMSMRIVDGVVSGPNLKGQLKLPVASNFIPFSGSFDINSKNNPQLVIYEKPSSLDIAMWKSTLQLEDESLLTADIKNINNQNTILPKGSLSGVLSMQMEGKEFLKAVKGSSAEMRANIKTLFNIEEEINSIGIKGLKIPNWNIDPYNSADKKYRSGNLDHSKAKLLINGKEFPLADATIKYELLDGKERIGLQFTSAKKNSQMTMTIWAKEDNDQFEFDHITQDLFQLNCDCVEGKSYGILRTNDYYNYANITTKDNVQYHGSLASSGNEQNRIHSSLLKNFSAGNDFVLKNENTLYWPLIDKDIKIQKTGNSIISKETLLIDQDIYKKLGFKASYNMPWESKFYIAQLQISEWKETGATAKITLELHAPYDPDDSKKLMTFKSDQLPASGNSIQIKDVDLILQNNYAGGPWVLKNYKWIAEYTSASPQVKNLARIDCISGFKYFQMNGQVAMKGLVHNVDKKDSEISFKLNTATMGNSHSLIDFIGTISDNSYNEFNKWMVHIKDQPQVNFKAGDNYSIYFDNSSLLKIPGNFESKSYSKSTSEKSFKGIIMEKAAIELLGFQDQNKEPLSIPIADVIYNISDIDGGLYSTFEKSDIIDQNLGAKISGWPYGLTKASFNIKKTTYDTELEIEGSISIPIFKNVPDKIKSVQFDSSWVSFTGVVYASSSDGVSRINTYFEFDDVSLKTYQSDFIPGLGVVLNEDSNISLEYNNIHKTWDPKGTFSGMGIVLLTSETMKAYGLSKFPDGMDFSLHCLTFEGMTLNESPAAASQSLVGDYGIKSIEFGTWGIVDYKGLYGIQDAKEGEKPETQTKDKNDVSTGSGNNKVKKPGDVKEVSTASGKIVKTKTGEVKTVSTASGRVIRTKSGVKTVSTASGSVKRTKKTSTTQSAAATAKAETKPEFNGLKFNVGCKGIQARGNNFELLIDVSVSLLGDNTEKKTEKEEVKTCAINAKGGVGLQFSKINGKYKAEGVNFKCLAVDASIGPVEIDGGLSILVTPKDQYGNPVVNNNHGTGFKAYLSATVMGLGGIQAVGQFGKKPINDKDSYYYGFIDLEAFKQSGFAIPPPTPSNPPIIDLYGGGGGLRINMKSVNVITEMQMKSDSKTAPADECPIPDAQYLKPGVGFSQNYEPEKGTYGGNFYLILGPWNELDNQSPPQYNIIAEPGLDLEISTDQKTGDLQFRKISINVNAYFKPSSLAKRRSDNIADAYAKLELNLQDKNIIGAFGMRMKVEEPNLQSPLAQIPEDYSTTNFNTKSNYAGGKLVFSFDKREGKKPFFNFKFGGSSIGNFSSKSKLKYNAALLNLNDLIKVKSGMYFQFGNEVDDLPPVKDLIPQVSDMESSQYDEVKSDEKTKITNAAGAGISFGYKGSIEGKTDIGPLTGNFEVGLGFNVLMKEMNNVSCTNTTNGSIGIRNWYAQGQAFGYANCNVNLTYNLLFISGRVNIMKAGAFILLQGKAPNPSYFSGRVNGSYSLLDGFLSGSFNMKVQLGAKCENLELPSPLEGINIFNQANISNGAYNVDRYTDISVTTNIALQKEFYVPQVDENGNPMQTETFIAEIKEVKLIQKNNGAEISNYKVIRNDKMGFDLKFYDPLLPLENYKFQYSFVWKKKVNGVFIENFESGKKGDNNKQAKIETGIIEFQSGNRSETIAPNMIEYMAPGDGQRYWHRNYADTEIKFKLKALEDAVQLFPEYCDGCKDYFQKSVKFKYYVLLKEFGIDGKPLDQKIIPVSSYPSSANYEKVLKSKSLSVHGDKYNINVLTEESVPISRVSFNDLKNMSLTQGAMYELSVIREPDINMDQFIKDIATQKAKENLEVKSNADFVVNKKNTTLDLYKESQAKKVIKEHTKVLHTSYFAVSNYLFLTEKLKSSKVTYIKSKIKRRDFQHPNDAYDVQRSTAISKYGESKFHSVKDDYYAFTLDNKNSEGLDKYDIMRLKRNMKLTYEQSYMPEERIKNDRYAGKGIHSVFDNLLSGYKDIGGYMRKVLYEYSKAENEGVAAYGNLNTSDGCKWGYNISGPKDERCLVLQPDEIAAKKLIHRVGYKSTYDPNYNEPVFENEVEFDFLLQDYRSRIIINQMAWLSRLSNGLNTNSDELNVWARGNYPEGEFLSENKRFNNFDWVLYGDVNKKNKGNEYTYIASEPGYQISYHGVSKLSYISFSTWNELFESKRDQGVYDFYEYSRFAPIRTVNQITETVITQPTELVENYWYKIRLNGTNLSLGDKNQAWTSLFGVCYPYKGYHYNDGQYGIYSLGAGGMPTIRGFRNIKDPMDDHENLWNFTSQSGGKMLLINERYKNYNGENPNETKYFPKVLDHGDHDWDNKNRNPSPPNFLGNEVEIVELNTPVFNPEKYYYIKAGSAYLTDDKGNNKWKIIQEGKFFRFQSANGYILKMHYYDHTWPKSDEWYITVDDKNFPSDIFNDPNAYYRSVWAVIPESNGSIYYFVKNIRYDGYFLAFRNGKIEAHITSYGDQVNIEEVK